MNAQTEMSVAEGVTWRFKCGVAIFVLKVVLVLTVLALPFSGLPVARGAALTGMIFITNKLLLILMIAVMGKAGFQQLKQIIGGYLPSLKSGAPVSPTRHAIGLAMFCLPIVSGMLEPYVDSIWPGLRSNIWQYQLFTDMMLIASIFVLGGNFWGKIRALFVRTAQVVDPADRMAA